MPRSSRIAPGGMVFHVLNRGVGKMRIFEKEGDYEAFERILEETRERSPMRICAYCLMPNHWHLVLWPENNGDLAAFMQRLTVTHATRWQRHKHRVGYGHVYQGRFKSFPVEAEDYFYQVVRYVERNAYRAKLAVQPDAWQWSSLHRFCHGSRKEKELLSTWPIPRPRGWRRHVAEPQTQAELVAIRRCVGRGAPLGSKDWIAETAKALGLEFAIRPRGRPKKGLK